MNDRYFKMCKQNIEKSLVHNTQLKIAAELLQKLKVYYYFIQYITLIHIQVHSSIGKTVLQLIYLPGAKTYIFV